MNLDFVEYLNNSIKTNALPHAFLVETNNAEQVLNDIVQVLYKNKLLKKENHINNLNYILIETEEKEIKKEKIVYLQERFSKHPIDNEYNIYIIKKAQLLNNSSSNKLLKFLEEPPANTIGFLIIDYGTAVTKTIYSRCQHFIINNEDGKPPFYKESKEFLEIIVYNENFKKLTNFKNKYKKYERNELLVIIKNALIMLDKNLKENIKLNINLSKNIILMDQILRMLECNVNIDLVLDKLLIELR